VCTTRHIPVIGLVGGVGSGKSSIARGAGENRNVAVIDADAFGHAVLRDPDVKARIRDVFGDSVLDSQGEVDRGALGARVFGDDAEARSRRHQLEQIVHPRIREAVFAGIQDACAGPRPPDAVLLDAALLLEAGWKDECDAVVFIDTNEQERLKRVQATRGWDARELQRRELSQLDLQVKRDAADFVIDNSQSLPQSIHELQDIIDQVRRDRCSVSDN
jgi:dephospho-CoA kinase